MMFLGKMKSRWSGPFNVTKIYPYGAIEVTYPENGTFMVNRQRLKIYHQQVNMNEGLEELKLLQLEE